MTIDVSDELERIRARHAYKFDRARDETRTLEWQKVQLAKAYVAMKAEVDEMLERQERQADRHVRVLNERIFGVGSIPGDPATLVVSARDAAARADSPATPDEAMTLLRQAERIGDEILARAVARVALERDWSDVGNAFLETREHLAEPMQELWQAHGATASRRDQFQLRMLISDMRPPELRGLSEYDIETLATGEPAALP